MNGLPPNSGNLLSEAAEMAQRARHAGQRLGMSRPAFLRVFEIHRFLQEGNYPNCNSLAKEIEVTPKTIRRDINFMRDQLGFPLEYDPLKRGYWYTREDQAEYEVCILFEGYAARVVSERQWHASQGIKLLKPDGSMIEFRVKLHGLEEITRWVLSWGSKARVLEPEALRERVRGEAEQMLAHFT